MNFKITDMGSLNKLLILTISILFSGQAFSQYGIPTKLSHPEKVKQTQTIVIIDFKEPLNKNIEAVLNKAMQKVWTINKYQVLDKDEVIDNYQNFKNADPKNPSFSFMYISYASLANVNHAKDRRIVLSYTLTENGKRHPTDPIVAVAQSEFNYDIYDLEAGLIKDLALLKSQIERGYFVKGELADPSIKEKTLYIPVNLMEKGSESKLKVYPYKYKVVTKEELSKAIKEKTAGICFIEQTNIDQPMMTVIDIETGNPLYHTKAGEPIKGFIDDIKLLKKSLK